MKKFLTIVGIIIVVGIIVALIWSAFRIKTPPIKDTFEPAPVDNWVAPTQPECVNCKG